MATRVADLDLLEGRGSLNTALRKEREDIWFLLGDFSSQRGIKKEAKWKI